MLKSKPLLIFTLLIGIAIAALLLKPKTQPTAANVPATPSQKTCQTEKQAFDIEAKFTAQVNSQIAYQSKLLFNLQLNQKGTQVQGLAQHIRLYSKAHKAPQKLNDITFIAQIDKHDKHLYSHFNSLGLPKQHPMLILAQVLKNLSFKSTTQTYQFSYDLIQGNYQYQQEKGLWQRYNLAGRNPKQPQNWQLQRENNCHTLNMYAKESRPLAFASVQGEIIYEIKAHASIPLSDISHLKFTPNSNASAQFEDTQINAEQFAKKVQSAKEMWSVINRFEENQDMGRLQKAADFMVANISSSELAQHLKSNLLSEDEKRNLAFALSLTNHPQADRYILQTLNQIPPQAGDQVDMQKVRLMVALTGRKTETRENYDGLMEVNNNPKESDNVKNNALISAAMSALKLANKGDSSAKEELAETLKQNIKQNNAQAASSMLAANNAGIDSLDAEIIPQLNAAQSNHRYSAATVLANRRQNYDLLIQHMQNESDNLINQVIVERIKKDALSQSQKQKLQQIAQQAKTQPQEYQKDKAKLIEKLLKTP